MSIFFSIVIPTYNRAHLIEKTINSVLKQTFKDFEILIIDDGSTDNTAELVRSKGLTDTRINYFFKENEERGAARNFGFEKAIGKYVVFLDSDDTFKNIHLETIYDVLSINPSINFIATKYTLDGGGGFAISGLRELSERFYDINIVLNGNPFACNFAVRRENSNLVLFKEDRQFIIVEDWVFLIENLHRDKIYLVDKCTVVMSDHDQRSMRGNQNKIISARLYALKWLLENYSFSDFQIKILCGNSYLFCAIHCYIDGNRRNGLRNLYLAIKYLGIEFRTILLSLKLLFGQKIIKKLF